MLRKLLKYEFMATARIFLPIYIVLFSFAIINRMISSLSILEWQAPQVISMVLYISILVIMFVVTFIMMIQRFYKNLLSDEGYLMFTLPTVPWKHIISKLLVSLVWIIASGLAAMISILIISANMVAISDFMNAVTTFFNYYSSYITASAILFVLEILLIGFISLVSAVLIIYASIAIGHLYNRNRLLASVGALIGLSTITQILFVIVGSVFSINITVDDLQVVGPVIHLVMFSIIFIIGIPTAGYFLVTNHILSKRLNLE